MNSQGTYPVPPVACVVAVRLAVEVVHVVSCVLRQAYACLCLLCVVGWSHRRGVGRCDQTRRVEVQVGWSAGASHLHQRPDQRFLRSGRLDPVRRARVIHHVSSLHLNLSLRHGVLLLILQCIHLRGQFRALCLYVHYFSDRAALQTTIQRRRPNF